MGKTYLETIKYMIVADFEVDGLVERPDVIGAIFGQSEGLLGSQLDIKELQQNGKIGRIEITVHQNNNKTNGNLKLPCSLSMVETAIIGASIESIDKVGPCDTKFKVKNIEDTRGLKRKQIKNRAIDLLGRIMQEEIPDTRELMDEITDTFKTRDIILYGPDKLPAGPTIESSKDIIIVEGRADVINMLKYGFTNIISTGGARIPKSLASIVRNKNITIFLDGDRGADIQQAQLLKVISVDYIARAPDGKEVEELTQKEINQALRRRIKSSYLDINKPKQPGLVKQTKFSTTHEHKVVSKPQVKTFTKPREVRETRDFKDTRTFKDTRDFRDTRTFKDTRDFRDTRTSKDTKDFKQDNEFSSMLSNIPNIERVDVVSDRNQRNDRNHSRDRNQRSNFRDRNNSRDRNQRYDRNNKTEYKNKPTTLKDKVESAVKTFNGNKVMPTNIAKPVIPIKREVFKVDVPKVEKPKETKQKKLLVLPKLTEKMKKNFLKILEDIDGKSESRILNEKLRRIGSAKNSDLLTKIKGFKPNKIYALVTDQEVTQELIKNSVDKGTMFIIAPKSKIKENKEINIVTYNELKK